jgi:hypothetical protein
MEKFGEGFEIFFYFLRLFYSNHTHNMFAIMLDPLFKSLWGVQNLVGHGNSI